MQGREGGGEKYVDTGKGEQGLSDVLHDTYPALAMCLILRQYVDRDNTVWISRRQYSPRDIQRHV